MRNRPSTSSPSADGDSFVDVAAMDLDDGGARAGGIPERVLELSLTPRHDAIGIDHRGDASLKTQICATVKACELPDDDDDEHRAPVDVTVALDVSGSMSGSKLDLCKKTLELLLRELRPKDRFGLVTFADDARLEIPTRKVTAEGKEAALSQIKKLQTRGCTNLSGGLGMAIQDLKAVETPNEVRAAFVLTDGLANRGVSDRQGILDLTKGCLGQGEGGEENAPPPPITVHAFGYGSDHDPRLLLDLSQVTSGGSYYFVENDSNVASAFGDALGGILSIVAQNVFLTIRVPPEAAMLGVKIETVHHENMTRQEDGSGSWRGAIGDFYAEESRDVLFEVTTAPGFKGAEPILHAVCSLSYMDTLKKRLVTTDPVSAGIHRPAGSEISASNLHVAVQWLRIRAAKAMKDAQALSRSGNLEAARSLISAALEDVRGERTEGAQSHPLVVEIVKDLNEVLGGLRDRSTYRTWGEMHLQRQERGHARQRCFDARYDEGAQALRSNAYRGGKKAAMSLKMHRSAEK